MRIAIILLLNCFSVVLLGQNKKITIPITVDTNYFATQNWVLNNTSAGTDDQTIDEFQILSNILRLSIEGDGEAAKTVSLAQYLDNTDNQAISGNYNPTSNILTLSLTNSPNVQFDLSDLQDSPLTNEEVQDIVGAMLSGNTETNITVTYQDADGTIDFEVDLSAYVTIASTANWDKDTSDDITDLVAGSNISITGTGNSRTISASGVINETDPTVPSHVKSITTQNIADWNNDEIGLDTSGTYHASIDQDLSIVNELIDSIKLNGRFLEIYDAGGIKNARIYPSDEYEDFQVLMINSSPCPTCVDVGGGKHLKWNVLPVSFTAETNPDWFIEPSEPKILLQLNSANNEYNVPLHSTDGSIKYGNFMPFYLDITVDTAKLATLHALQDTAAAIRADFPTGFITTETDPTVPSHVKSITTQNIADWNNDEIGLDTSGTYHASIDLDIDPTNELFDSTYIYASLADTAAAIRADFPAETDPTVGSHIKAITTQNITDWNNDEVNDADADPTNELNTSFTYNSGTGLLSLTDAAGTKSVTITAGGSNWTTNGDGDIYRNSPVGIYQNDPFYGFEVRKNPALSLGSGIASIGDGSNGLFVKESTSSNPWSVNIIGPFRLDNGSLGNAGWYDNAGSRGTAGQVWKAISATQQGWAADEVGITTETDPTVGSHIKAITTTDIANWNNDLAGDDDWTITSNLLSSTKPISITTTGGLGLNDLATFASAGGWGSTKLQWFNNASNYRGLKIGYLHLETVFRNRLGWNTEQPLSSIDFNIGYSAGLDNALRITHTPNTNFTTIRNNNSGDAIFQSSNGRFTFSSTSTPIAQITPTATLSLFAPSGAGSTALFSTARAGGWGATNFVQYYTSGTDWGMEIANGYTNNYALRLNLATNQITAAGSLVVSNRTGTAAKNAVFTSSGQLVEQDFSDYDFTTLGDWDVNTVSHKSDSDEILVVSGVDGVTRRMQALDLPKQYTQSIYQNRTLSDLTTSTTEERIDLTNTTIAPYYTSGISPPTPNGTSEQWTINANGFYELHLYSQPINASGDYTISLYKNSTKISYYDRRYQFDITSDRTNEYIIKGYFENGDVVYLTRYHSSGGGGPQFGEGHYTWTKLN